MFKQILGAAGAGLASLVFAATVMAAGPTPTPSSATTQTRDTVPAVLGLTQAQDGQSLAQIAAKQKVDPQRLVDALVARWTSRIDVRVTNGALTADEATKLKAEVQTQATSMVNQVTLGGMQGAAIGAGPRNGAGRGAGMANGTGARGTGTGTGPHGAGQP